MEASVYLPAEWRQAAAAGTSLPERTEGTALFADISGFTPLTEALARTLGLRRGAEELAGYLNQVYDALIAEVDRYGGSVIGFAGDAITCWFDDRSEPAAWRAAACALAMQEAMLRFAAIPVSGQDPVPLSIKVSVASGPARRFLVGDPEVQRKAALAGETLARMAEGEHLAGRGEVLVDAQTAFRLGEKASTIEWRAAEAAGGVSFAVVDRLFVDVPPDPWPPLAAGALREDQVRPWVLPPVYARLAAGLGEFLTELRPAVALFMRFAGIDYDTDEAAGAKLDAYVRWVQTVIACCEGTLIQLTIGDKGSYLYAAFGAPLAHEDDPRRAVTAALALRTPPAHLGFIKPVQIGICRGTMRTGTYGGTTRRTYGSLGDQVNLAARLMAYAQPGQVIVDQNLQKAISAVFAWELLPAIRVKGKTEPVQIARLVGETRSTLPAATATCSGALVGRRAETERLAHAIDRLTEGGRGLLFVEGQAGVGKSRLVAELVRMAHRRGANVLTGAGQSIEQQSPYRAWRGLFAAFFESNNPADIRNVVEYLAPEHLAHFPLLNDLLNLGLPETAQTAAWEPERRRTALLTLLLALLQGSAAARPLILILEDAQWLDSLSWHLARRVADLEASILLVIVARPSGEEAQGREAAADLWSLPHAEFIGLAPMSEAETIAVASARLGLPAETLPLPVVDLLRRRAGGNPFFAEQLVLTLQDQGLIHLEEAGAGLRCVVGGDLETVRGSLPETIQGLILARIDRLPPEAQLVLKVAAVIGRTFAYNPLSHTLKQHVPVSDAALASHLGMLDARELALLSIPEPKLTYVFKHLTIWDIAYETLPYAQRRRLHADVASWYEGAYTSDLSPVYALLAYHWSGAEDAGKATHYLLMAGDEARRLYALPEAIEYYQRALVFLRQGTDFEQTARTLMKLGLTFHLAFDYPAARAAYDEGFALWQQAAAAPAVSLPPATRPFRADWPYLPLTLDPGQGCGDGDTIGVLDQLYSGLLSLGPGLEVVPDAARRWEILDDGRTYVFYLRDDACWSDGVPLTAADFVCAWRRVLDPALRSPGASTLYDVRGAQAYHQGTNADPASVAVRAVDAQTLAVELEQPTSYFPYLVAYSAAYPVPCHVLAAHGEAWAQPEHLVTNGPFRLDSWQQVNDQEGSLVLVRSPSYHGRFGGNVERVELVTRATDAERLGAYEAGELEMLTFRQLSGDRDRIRQRHAGEYLSAPYLATTYVILNPTRPPLDDPRVRQALVLAVDRDQRTDPKLKDFCFPATGGFVPPGMPGHVPGIGLPYDPARARDLLAQAGYRGDTFPAMEFLACPDHEPIPSYLLAQWRDNLGLAIRVTTVDLQTLFDRLESAPPDIFINIWVNDYPDPDNFLRAAKPLAWSKWQDPAYRELVETARRVPDQGSRLDLYRMAEEILIEAAAIVPFEYWRTHLLVQPWVKRFPTSAIKWCYWKDVLLGPEQGGRP